MYEERALALERRTIDRLLLRGCRQHLGARTQRVDARETCLDALCVQAPSRDRGAHSGKGPARWVDVGEQQQIGSRRKRSFRGFLDRPIAERLHLQVIRANHAAESKLISKQLGQEHLRLRGRTIARIERRHGDVASHDDVDARIDGCAEGYEINGAQLLRVPARKGQRDVRVRGCAAVAWEVFGSRDDACIAQPEHCSHDVPAHRARFAAERAQSDDRIVRIGVDVGIGCQIKCDAQGMQVDADGAIDVARQRGVAGGAERHGRRHRNAERIQTLHRAAFLVDGDQQRRPPGRARGLQRSGERARLVGGGNIAAKEDGPGRPRNERKRFVRNGGPVETSQDQTAEPARELFHACLHRPVQEHSSRSLLRRTIA